MTTLRVKRSVAIALVGFCLVLSGCDIERQIDDAIAQLNQANITFAKIAQILGDLDKNLNNGAYRDQVEEIIGQAGIDAQIGGEALVDFFRARVIEDLKNIKAQIKHQPPAPRIPVLSKAVIPQINVTAAARSSVTVAGWNLDVAKKDPATYSIVIQNSQERERPVDRNFVTFQGQYSVTLNISITGIPFHPGDQKVVFNGYPEGFEIAIINSVAAPPPVTQAWIVSKQDHDDKDPDINAKFTLFSGTRISPTETQWTLLWDFSVGKGRGWPDPGNVRIKIVPANPQAHRCLYQVPFFLFGPHPPMIVDQDCEYLVVQSKVTALPFGSGKPGKLTIEELEDNSGWNARFELLVDTKDNNRHQLLLTDSLALGDNAPHLREGIFTW